MFSFDEELITRLQEQDEQAYRVFYEETVDILYRFMVSHYFLSEAEMEDLLSDFYLKFWRVVQKYDDQYKFETFVRTVFKNLIKDYFKKKKEGHFTVDELDAHHGDEQVQEILEQKYQLDQIKEGLEELDVTSQEVLYLKFIEEQSYEEMSDLLGIKEPAVRQRLSRALKRLKALLDET